jgi:hypothetical protein
MNVSCRTTFHWTQDSAITDDDFLRYYSALPYAAKFFAVFDCCHSGGLTRDGARKIRAITPPDDIRHRMLRWNKAEQMWEERDLRSLIPIWWQAASSVKNTWDATAARKNWAPQ